MTSHLRSATEARRYELALRLLSRIDILPSGCWRWTGRCLPNGYGQMQTGRRTPAGHYSPDLVHRVSYELFVGQIPGDMTIDHRCRNRACAFPGHFEVVTRVENTIRGASGENSGVAILDEASVREIRGLYQSGEWTQARLAERYGVSQVAISAVVRRETWRSVQ